MGIFNFKRKVISEDKFLKQYEKMLADEEIVIVVYRLIRDLIILTNLRLIVVDKRGITGKKKTIRSYPLNRISCYEIENAPFFDIDNEVCIWITGLKEPLKLTF